MEACKRKRPVQFTCERMKRYLGEWHVEVTALDKAFPSAGRASFAGSTETEAQLMLEALCDSKGCIRMSRGYIRDGGTVVTEGPLKGRESCIRKIDRHKRLARLELPGSFMGERFIDVGLEIYAKEQPGDCLAHD